MGIETLADGGDKKPDVKSNSSNSSRRNQQRRDQHKQYPKKEHFQGAHPDLMGCTFTACTTRANQHCFTKTNERIRALIGQGFNPHVLQSIEEGKFVLPIEPMLTTQPDGTVLKIEEMKFNKKYDRWLGLEYTIQKELKQAYAIYYGQCDDDMKIIGDK